MSLPIASPVDEADSSSTMKSSRNDETTGADAKSGSNGNKRDDRGGSGGGTGVQIDFDVYKRRLDCLVRSWENFKQDVWLGVDAIAVVTPPPSDDCRYLTSSALQIWLFEYELPEMVMVFLPGYLHILCSHTKAGVLAKLRKYSKTLTGVEVVLYPKTRTNDGRVEMQNILDIVKSSRRALPGGGVLKKRPIVGYLQNEAPDGALTENWSVLLQGSGLILVNVERSFSELFAVKEESELINIRKASFLSSSVLKSYVVPQLQVGIDNEKNVSHAEFSVNTEQQIMHPPDEVKLDLEEDDMDICYPPIFQSGGAFDLKLSAVSDNNFVDYNAKGVIICALGVRYRSYCSNIARTYLIDPDGFQHKAYTVLLEAHVHAINTLLPGRTMSTVYKAAVAVVRDKGPEFLPHLTKNVGTGIGIKLRESEFTLSARNEQFVKSGMVFNVATGFHGLKNPASENPENCTFSLLLADTVVVTQQGPQITTSQCSKSDVLYRIKYEEQERKIEEA